MAKVKPGHDAKEPCRACRDLTDSIASMEARLLEHAARASGLSGAAHRAFDLLMLDLEMPGKPNLAFRANELLSSASAIARIVASYFEELKGLRARLAEHRIPPEKREKA